jgi:hypothetical protein
MLNRSLAQTSKKALLPNKKLNKAARDLNILPDLADNSLFSVCKLADAGYTTIFHPGEEGVTVHWQDDIYIRVKKPAMMRGWRDDNGLWRVPIKEGDTRDTVKNENTDTLLIQRPPPSQAFQNVYKLSSNKRVVKYLHAALGFPTKATMLNAVRKNWLVGWPGLTVESVNNFFLSPTKLRKGT